MAAKELEPELRTGDWLVLVFALWSTPDVASIFDAIDAVPKIHTSVKLGVRPMVEIEETAVWCPGNVISPRTPVWLVFRAGKLCGQVDGRLTVNEVREFVEETLAEGAKGR